MGTVGSHDSSQGEQFPELLAVAGSDLGASNDC